MSIYSVKKKVHIIAIDPSVYNIHDVLDRKLPENHPLNGAWIVRLRRAFWGLEKVPPLQLLSAENLTEEEMKELTEWFESFKGDQQKEGEL